MSNRMYVHMHVLQTHAHARLHHEGMSECVLEFCACARNMGHQMCKIGVCGCLN